MSCQADQTRIGNARLGPVLNKMAGLESAVPSEGKGHTFEACRVRQLFLYFTTRYARSD
jgi:hypothetical protein